jgi:3-deoxy-manno-octulosonate cytidylyltransferase (CMP-KDO synthetase)
VRRITEFAVCDRVVVATDAAEVARAVAAAGYEVVLTSEQCGSGTERCAEVVANDEFKGFDFILNIQGDEPLVARGALVGAMARVRGGDPIGTAAGPLEAAHVADPARVKVVVDARGRAVYFSRAPIPFDRDGTGTVRYRQHIGVYAYTRDALTRWVQLPEVPEERWERLEQLRPLLHGVVIGVADVPDPPARGVDTPEDLAWATTVLTRHLKEVSP